MANGRDKNGKFAAGNQIAVGHDGRKAGRPKREHEERFLAAMYRGVSEKDWEDATRAIAEKAMGGNIQAWRALAPYMVGQPVVRVEADIDITNDLTVRYDRALRRAYGEDAEDGEEGG